MWFSLAVLIVPALSSLADSATQTDWSGGYGTSSPVTQWTNRFIEQDSLDYLTEPGAVSLCHSSNIIAGEKGFFNPIVADIDIDGDMDVVDLSWGSGANGLYWFENVDDGSGWVEHVISLGGSYRDHIWASDFDSDGDPDILASYHEYGGTGQVRIYENLLGAEWQAWTIADSVPGSEHESPACYPADVDGDLDIDVIGEYYTIPGPDPVEHLVWWENPGSIEDVWWEHEVISREDYTFYEWVYGDDRDGDGDTDILTTTSSFDGDSIIWYEQNPGMDWASQPVYEHDRSVGQALFTDVDGDSTIDIVGMEPHYGSLFWLREESPGNWVINMIDEAPGLLRWCGIEDLDDDGDEDIYTNGDVLFWWENVGGTGEEWSRHLIYSYPSCHGAVTATDIDSDGFYDFVCLGYDAIVWVETERLAEKGGVTSQILDVGSYVDWGEISWVADEPPGTDICFQVRCEKSGMWPPVMDEWSVPFSSPCSLSTHIPNGRRAFQYRCLLDGPNPESSPTLEEITITWSTLGIYDPDADVTALIGPSPNPSTGFVSIQFSLSRASSATFQVFDVSGRLVRNACSARPEGQNEIQFEELQPGVYIVRMLCEHFSATDRFIVLE